MSTTTVTADIVADAAACAGVVAASVARQAAVAALREHHADDPTLLAHVERLAGKRRDDLNKPGPCGATPLLVVCLKGDGELTAPLLEAGADPAAEAWCGTQHQNWKQTERNG